MHCDVGAALTQRAVRIVAVAHYRTVARVAARSGLHMGRPKGAKNKSTLLKQAVAAKNTRPASDFFKPVRRKAGLSGGTSATIERPSCVDADDAAI